MLSLCTSFITWTLVYDNQGPGTIKQRHDIVKLFIGNLDDTIVQVGLIDDCTLHSIGNALGIVEQRCK